MQRSLFLTALALAAVVGAPAGLKAATTNAEAAANYQTALGDNLKAAAAFLADPFAKGLAFATGSQAFSPVQAKPLLGFNLGLGAGASVTPIDRGGLKAAAKANGTDLDELAKGLPDQLPLALGSLNAHVGLPKLAFFESMDLGLRLSGLNVAQDTASVNLSGFGVELRGNVFEAGLVSPVTLTLGLGFEQLKTEVRFTQASQSLSGTFEGASYSGNTRFVGQLDSQIQQMRLKASVSRKLLFFTPYAGLALDMNSGDTSFRWAQEGTLTFTGLGGGAATAGTVEGRATKPAPGLDTRLAAGFELSFLALYLAVGGEYGALSQGAGGHVQLGLQFR